MEKANQKILNSFRPMSSEQTTKKNGTRDGIMSVIFSERNGKRLLFSKDLVDTLCVEDEIYISNNGTSIMLCADPMSGNGNPFILKDYAGGRKVLYCSDLVKEVSEILNLDFTDCVCNTITKVKYVDDDVSGYSFALIGKDAEEEGDEADGNQ